MKTTWFVMFFTLMALTECKPKLVEGDIVLDKKLEVIRSHHGATGRTKRSLLKTKPVHEHKWKHGFVPYVISVDLGMQARKAIEKAIQQIERYTCIQFSPWNKEHDFVEFIKDEGCFSSIGRQGGRQKISIGAGCEFTTTVVHELLHALGMFHEQTRLDRNLYVKVLWWNVEEVAKKNFDTYDHGIIDALNYHYDYKSAMHYSNKDFSKNGLDTLQSLEKPFQRLGSDRGMSKLDIKKIYKYYKCYRKKKRPQKEPCKDVMSWCSHYTQHCSTRWFAEEYCQKSCKTCLT
ncbi:zinc metalloproteinase nas-6-like [Hydractinia symbiolongicarpus]|uniref:zinc metalloproteinase nas-6-like n=1 Tax=Hydractinia symbiolongicarpus TaxID=13093 RepID=UPI00254A9151|nr:zinc metalloproteinase nas-6-like [Hydractinia symbiolongicarpus]